jgi:hypothetical protein
MRRSGRLADLAEPRRDGAPALDTGDIASARECANALGDKGFGTIAMVALDMESAGP